MELAGKKVLVTGASSGLGKAFAASLVEKGAHVWGTSRSPGAHDWEEGVTPVSLDLSDVEEIDSQWDSAGLDAIGFDVLVNNAGAGVFGEFEEVGFADWERQVELMLLSPMKLAHLALSQLRASGEGVLANVSSLAVEYPIPFMAGYNAAKGGLTAFSESLALELDRVRVIDFRPGDFRTGFNESAKVAGRGKAFERAWKVICERLSSSPQPAVAAERLIRALERGESGTVRAGTIFQRVAAPFFARFSSGEMQRRANRAYYKLGA